MTGCHYSWETVRNLSRRYIAAAIVFLPMLFLLLAPSRAAAVNVVMQHNDYFRTGANLDEFLLTTANVNVSQFGKLFTRPVDGQIYGQPLYIQGLVISNQTHNVVYVCTEHNSVYAFDADDPAASNALWQVNLGPSVSTTDVSNCPNITPEIGITSTPVINLSNNTIYVCAKTKESGNFFHRLHALDILSGQEKFGGPVVIQAVAPGMGDGSVAGTNTFSALQELNRPALLLLSNVVYLAFGSHCDWTPYHGWFLGYNATNLQQVSVLNTTPNGSDGAIWSCGMGPAVDPAGNIYVMTGNGTFDATNGVDYGQSFLKLSTSNGPATIVDSFTPHDAATLNVTDLDIGTGGPVLLPGTNILVGIAKSGAMYVLNENHLGNFVATADTNTVQVFLPTAGCDGVGQDPVYWNGPSNQVLYIWSGFDVLKALAFNGQTFQTTPLATATTAQNDTAGGLSLSANGTNAGSGIIWGTEAGSGGTLHAYDAGNVAHELWNSQLYAGRDALGNYTKFCAPTIVNGKVYVATTSSNLAVYGLLPPPPEFQITGVSLQGNDVALTWTTFGGTTNIVQATNGAGNGSYSNNFTNISPPISIPGDGPLSTNYLDAGGATNLPARYYRIEIMVPSPSDNAADPAYSGGWSTGANGGTGFGPWTLTGSGVLGSSSNGFFIGSSTNNAAGASPGIDVGGKSWGIYANNGNFTAGYRTFADGPLQVGESFHIDVDNGNINSNQSVGFTIRNGNAAASFTNYNTGARFEFLYIGNSASNSYQVVDSPGRHYIGVPFTGTGLHLVFRLGTNDTYTLTVIDNASSATSMVLNSSLGGATNSTLDSFALYNRNAGSDAPHNTFFNSLRLTGP